MLQHGLMVNQCYQKLLKRDASMMQHLGKDLLEKCLSYQHDPILMRHYHIYHDCGKPDCHSQDEKGTHYHGHEDMSAIIHAKHFDCQEATQLIANDMIFHKSNSTQLNEWLSQKDKTFIYSLYLTAWAEIFANCQMFGGVESEGFKIKKKRLLKHFKIIENHFEKNKNISMKV